MLNVMIVLGGLIGILFVVSIGKEMKYRENGYYFEARMWKKIMYVSGIISVVIIYTAALLIQ